NGERMTQTTNVQCPIVKISNRSVERSRHFRRRSYDIAIILNRKYKLTVKFKFATQVDLTDTLTIKCGVGIRSQYHPCMIRKRNSFIRSQRYFVVGTKPIRPNTGTRRKDKMIFRRSTVSQLYKRDSIYGSFCRCEVQSKYNQI